MKPAPFDYAAPATVSEALALLDEDSRPLAGGQSLVPMLNFRLARPARLVDLERTAGLDRLAVELDVLRIGAMARQAAVERSPLVAQHWPLLRQALRLVGHPQIRSRGTVGGSVAHADPKAELPVALTALDARFHVRSTTGARTLAAGELFRGPLMTALEPDELLVEIEVAAPPPGARTAFVEHARTHGDFAVAGAAVVLAPGHTAIALLGAASVPIRATEAESALAGGASAAEAAQLAAADVSDPYRRALLTALTERAIVAAAPPDPPDERGIVAAAPPDAPDAGGDR
jgi:CO/xanthine dehydrogenase FAD-binding subunit